jgi:ERCC4-type nuclease
MNDLSNNWVIKIDSRENVLKDQIQHLLNIAPSYKGIQLVSENMPLGDVIIYFNGIEKIILERKTINDLSSSIKDGRYEEQSYRLDGLAHCNHNIIYLIEGDVNKMNRFKSSFTVDSLTIFSAIFSLNYYKGFSVIRTFSLEESAFFICNTTNKLRKGEEEGRKPYFGGVKSELKTKKELENKEIIENNENEIDENNIELQDNEDYQNNSYTNLVKKVKKENITPENIGEIILSQIPGISASTAIAIMEEFKTIPNLILKIQENENCLSNIKHKNKNRKINKTSIANINKFLLNK